MFFLIIILNFWKIFIIINNVHNLYLRNFSKILELGNRTFLALNQELCYGSF